MGMVVEASEPVTNICKCETAGCLQADRSTSPAVFVVTKPVILRQTQDQ